ncbi:MAG TPA: hypothetical protein VII61_09640 [Ktedonobacteraceae bacterium]
MHSNTGGCTPTRRLATVFVAKASNYRKLSLTQVCTHFLKLSVAERARCLIGLAAPQFREQLERAAYELHLFASSAK